MNRRALHATASFVALAAHQAEEALLGPSWAAANAEWLRPAVGANLVEAWTAPTFRPMLLGITVAVLAVAIGAARAGARSAALYLLLGTLALFAANALVPHLAAATWLGRYNPGAVTAGALVLPVAIWVFAASLRDGSATPRGSIAAAVAGAAVYALFLAAMRGA